MQWWCGFRLQIQSIFCNFAKRSTWVNTEYPCSRVYSKGNIETIHMIFVKGWRAIHLLVNFNDDSKTKNVWNYLDCHTRMELREKSLRFWLLNLKAYVFKKKGSFTLLNHYILVITPFYISGNILMTSNNCHLYMFTVVLVTTSLCICQQTILAKFVCACSKLHPIISTKITTYVFYIFAPKMLDMSQCFFIKFLCLKCLLILLGGFTQDKWNLVNR